MFIIIYITWPKICLPNIYSQFGNDTKQKPKAPAKEVIYACFYSLFMQTNVALTRGRRGENSTDFTVNNSLIRRKTTYISIIGATKIYSFFNKTVLVEILRFFKT